MTGDLIDSNALTGVKIYLITKGLSIKMGVPGLYWYITQNYNIYKTPAVLSKCILYIDGNAFLYPIVAYLETKKVGVEDVVAAYEQFVLGLFYEIRPKTIFLSFDGPPPEAKLYQQRQRRFRGVLESGAAGAGAGATGAGAGAGGFDKNSLSPGTSFLSAVDKGIEERIAKSARSLFTYYHSSTHTPGEGEHKIMEFIKQDRDHHNHCLLGCDGDLLMLGMTTEKQVFLLRPNDQNQTTDWLFEKKHFTSIFVVLDLTQLRNEIVSTIPVWDFIFLCFLLGNDFVPRLRCISSLRNGIDFFLNVYKTTQNPPIIIDTKIQPVALRTFLLAIKTSEQRLLKEQLIEQQAAVKLDQKFIDPNLLDVQDWKEFKRRYYEYFGTLRTNDICKEYLSILTWCFYYYVYGTVSWRGVYTRHYAPLIEDLCTFLLSNPLPVFSSTQGPIRPFTQLVSILPEVSLKRYLADDIIEAIMPILRDKNLFPKEVEIDFRGKRKEFEGIVKINTIDLNAIELLIAQSKSFKYSPLNQFQRTKLYKKLEG